MDIVDPQTRSRMMSGIRGRNTRPEVALRKALHAHGFRFRLHSTALPGRPDIVLPRHKVIILVHGCFWHRHAGCRYTTMPATRPEFWTSKFRRTVERDGENVGSLLALGWRVAVIWECALSRSEIAATTSSLAEWVRSPKAEPTLELGAGS